MNKEEKVTEDVFFLYINMYKEEIFTCKVTGAKVKIIYADQTVITYWYFDDVRRELHRLTPAEFLENFTN